MRYASLLSSQDVSHSNASPPVTTHFFCPFMASSPISMPLLPPVSHSLLFHPGTPIPTRADKG